MYLSFTSLLALTETATSYRLLEVFEDCHFEFLAHRNCVTVSAFVIIYYGIVQRLPCLSVLSVVISYKFVHVEYS